MEGAPVGQKKRLRQLSIMPGAMKLRQKPGRGQVTKAGRSVHGSVIGHGTLRW